MKVGCRMNEPAKGAFKEYPIEQQPIRIPIDVYDELAELITCKLESISNTFIPSIKKAINKPDTGDLDVIIDPFNRSTWREDFKDIFKDYIIATKSNGPQLMCVMRGLINDDKYMIDFILSKEGSFEYRKNYSKFGTIIPAVVGSFARSLKYKFDQNELSLRLISRKGNYHNIPLTSNFFTALKILMLDPIPFLEDRLYTPEQVADWIINSPRFDSNTWHTPPQTDGQTIVTKNKKSHRAIKQKPIVQNAYAIIDDTTKTAEWDNADFKIERELLGIDFIDHIIQIVNETEERQHKVVSGDEIIQILKISPGYIIGRILKHIEDNKLDREAALKYLDGLNINNAIIPH